MFAKRGLSVWFSVLMLIFTLGTSVGFAQDFDVEFILRTAIGVAGGPPMAFVGVGGDINGVTNPELRVNVGDVVKITLINGDPVEHDFTLPDLNQTTGSIRAVGEMATFTFTADTAGTYRYVCSIPGHEQAGMVGNLVVVDPNAVQVDDAPEAASIVRNPADVPVSIGARDATTVVIDIETIEVEGQLADGTTYTYWTFGGQVPGPMIRVRVGDVVQLNMHNHESSHNLHSIDLHAVTGPGGGAVATQTIAGETTSFSFTALNPGVYVYHCATPSVPTHISNGMYGLIVVEPEGGLPPVDREFYVMQGELYTQQAYGTAGHLDFNYEALLDEDAEYFTFNGAALGLASDENALRANVGETVRIFFGVGGPNATSSFHVIGEIFDRVYDQASLTSNPLTDVQTTTVAPGGATMVEFQVDYPGRYILVDHALSRLERGLAGYLYVEGEADPAIFNTDGTMDMSGH